MPIYEGKGAKVSLFLLIFYSLSATESSTIQKKQEHMEGTNYLHPKMRALKAQQIGLSNHKNAFNTGVLDGNWSEERNALENSLRAVPAKLNDATTQRADFQHPYDFGASRNIPVGPQKIMPTKETDKQIVFTHAKEPDYQSYVSINELTFKTPFQREASMKTDKALKIHPFAVETKMSKLEQKKKEWAAEVQAEKNFSETTFATTYKTEIGKNCQESTQRLQGGTSIWGENTASLNSDYHKIKLRSEYPIKQSPLATLPQQRNSAGNERIAAKRSMQME